MNRGIEILGCPARRIVPPQGNADDARDDGGIAGRCDEWVLEHHSAQQPGHAAGQVCPHDSCRDGAAVPGSDDLWHGGEHGHGAHEARQGSHQAYDEEGTARREHEHGADLKETERSHGAQVLTECGHPQFAPAHGEVHQSVVGTQNGSQDVGVEENHEAPVACVQPGQDPVEAPLPAHVGDGNDGRRVSLTGRSRHLPMPHMRVGTHLHEAVSHNA
mmetsp:Transcript_54333/g.117596  ORF Transcript_54333/g.117596 Transcript_54333/m.117596 type:complete len:217 (+) Transcript_54333:196-846(+)